MRIYKAGSDPIVANGPRVHAVAVIEAAPGARVKLGRGSDFGPIYCGEVLESVEGWDYLELDAAFDVTLRVFQAPLSRGRQLNAGNGDSSRGVTSEPLHAAATNPVAVAAGAAPTQILDANQRTTLTVYNDGTVAVYLSAEAGLLNTGAGAEFVLKPAAAAGDGSGGFLSLPGWCGPIYAIGAAGLASSLRVMAY